MYIIFNIILHWYIIWLKLSKKKVWIFHSLRNIFKSHCRFFFFLRVSYLVAWKPEWEGELPSAGSLPEWLQLPGHGQAEFRCPELHPCLPHGIATLLSNGLLEVDFHWCQHFLQNGFLLSDLCSYSWTTDTYYWSF